MGVGVLIDGKWTDDDETYRKGGAFVRATTAFRAFVTADGSSAFPAEAGRYHLYVARPCPWCHRTMIFRALKKLEDVVSMSMVEPLLLLEDGWKFAVPDRITGARFVHELRLGKISGSLAQDFVGLPKLTVFALQRLQLLRHIRRNAGRAAAVAVSLLHPFMQRLRRAADLGRDR